MVFYRKNVLVLIFMNNTFWNFNLISVIRFFFVSILLQVVFPSCLKTSSHASSRSVYVDYLSFRINVLFICSSFLCFKSYELADMFPIFISFDSDISFTTGLPKTRHKHIKLKTEEFIRSTYNLFCYRLAIMTPRTKYSVTKILKYHLFKFYSWWSGNVHCNCCISTNKGVHFLKTKQLPSRNMWWSQIYQTHVTLCW